MSFNIRVSSDFSNLIPKWEELLTRATYNKIFFHPIYQQTWWQTLGRGEPHIVSVWKDNRMIAIAPFFIDKKRLSFVGCKDVTDYLDIIFEEKYAQDIFLLINQHLQHLFATQTIISIELCSIPHHSQTLIELPKLKTLLPNLDIQLTEQDVCPQIELPNNFDAYLESLDRKQRHEVKRKWRKLENEAEIRFSTVTNLNFKPQQLNAVKTFIELHQLSSPDKNQFWNNHHRAFFDILLPNFAQAGWLKLFFLEITAWKDNSYQLPLPQAPIAAMLIFDYQEIYNLYNSGFNPIYRKLSAGQVLTSYTIEQAIQQGKTTYDFLRGDEEYKFRLGGIPMSVMDLSISLQH